MNRNGQPLPCKLDELGCDSTSLDPYAYVWDNPDNCIFTVLKEEYVNMIKNDDQYYIVSRNDSENKYLFEINNRLQKLCKNHQMYILQPMNLCLLPSFMVDLT